MAAKAIKRLLGLDYEDNIPDDHKQILDDRINTYESGVAKTIDWNEVKKKLSGNH